MDATQARKIEVAAKLRNQASSLNERARVALRQPYSAAVAAEAKSLKDRAKVASRRADRVLGLKGMVRRESSN